MRILLIEDDDTLRDNVRELLEKNDYACDVAANGVDGLHCGREYPVDVAIIDLGLPQLNGVEIIKTLRAEKYSYPILILTARDDWQDKVSGLEAGADDYLTKPFNNNELLARVNALLRRSKGFADPNITIGHLTLDTSGKTLSVEGKPLGTTAYEYRLIECLMLNAGKVMSKTALVEHIYDEDKEHDSNVIEVFVRRLRKKLEPFDQHKLIETVRGQGYRLAAVPR